MMRTWDGLLAIDKPAGPTSHDVVAAIRRTTGARRVGHTGTLDPSATGLLLLVLGRATRLAQFVPSAPKIYRGEFVLGIRTATDDLAGEVTHRHDGALPDLESVRRAAASQVGPRLQAPPEYSARSVDGTRLYRAARRGIRLEAAPAQVRIDRFDVAAAGAPDRFAYGIEVSAGTYVRSAVRDLGMDLGCGAAVASLRRLRIGPFSVDDAIPLGSAADVLRARLVPLDSMPLGMPPVVLSSALEASRFAAGVALPLPSRTPGDDQEAASVRDGGGRLLGIGRVEGSVLKPRVVLIEQH